jgi:plastocyanin
MRVEHLLKHFGRLSLYGLAGWALACPLSAQATNTNVTVSDGANSLAFTPNAVKINVHDQVTWIWGGTHPHSTTSSSTPSLWDSGVKTAPTPSFSFTFTSSGSYPYFCVIHGFTGSVTVQATNVPPSVAITSPTNGASFIAPANVTIQAAASDSDGSVTNVQFLDGVTSLGHASSSPYSISANLALGSHTLTAVASDNLGATTTSSNVLIKVVTPVQIILSSPKRVSASAFQFDYSADPGLSYVVLRSGGLPGFTAISTNTATTNTVNFLDNSATETVNFYRVHLLPNP